MNIGLYWDLRATDPQRHTGVGKHVIGVLRYLQSRPEVGLRVLLSKDQERLWPKQSAAFGLEALPAYRLPHVQKFYRLFHGLGAWPALDEALDGLDLVYSPMECFLRTAAVPFVNTIHGVPCFEKTVPSAVYNSWVYHRERMRQRYFFKLSRKYACCSLVVSNYLAGRVAAISGICPERLPVVANGVDPIFFESSSVQSESRAERPRLLVVGGANRFDGATAVLRIARLLNQRLPKARIWIVGDRHESPLEHVLARLPNVVFAGFLPSRRLAEEMCRATALLYLPAVESFGIIGAEAMAIGLPIIASPSTALPEVLGEAAQWIDLSGKDDQILEDIIAVCRDEALRTRLIEAGHRRATEMTWPAVGARVLSALKNALRA